MANGVGGLGVNMDIGDVLDLVVDVDSDLSDNWGSDDMLTDLVDRDNGLVDGVVDCGHGSSRIGNSRGGSMGGSRDNGMGSNNSGSIGSSWGSNNSSGVRSYSSISSSKTSVSSSKTSVSQSSKTRVSSEAS